MQFAGDMPEDLSWIQSLDTSMEKLENNCKLENKLYFICIQNYKKQNNVYRCTQTLLLYLQLKDKKPILKYSINSE